MLFLIPLLHTEKSKREMVREGSTINVACIMEGWKLIGPPVFLDVMKHQVGTMRGAKGSPFSPYLFH